MAGCSISYLTETGFGASTFSGLTPIRRNRAASEVYHSHRVSLGAIEPFAEIGLSVAEDKIALSMAELTGEIWLMESAE